jgi:hypothetical protein
MSPAALALPDPTARDLLTLLESLTVFAGLAVINAAGWLLAAHLLGWPGALLTALVGVLMTAARLPVEVCRRERSRWWQGPPPGGLMAA